MDGNPSTLGAALALRAAADPDRLAYADAERRMSFGELAEGAAALAGALHGAGVDVGDCVALVLPASVGFAEAFWALQLLGATPCALNPSLPAEATRRRGERLRARLILSADTVAGLPRTRTPPPQLETGGEDIAFLQPTSGTSGEPRLAMVRQRNVLGYLEASREAMAVTSEDVLVSWVPPWHDLGLVRFVIAAVSFGTACHIVVPSIRTIPLWLRTISDVGGTLSGAPDFAYRLATRLADPATIDLSSLRSSTNGGEAVRATSIEAFEERFGVPGVIAPAYGLAEATLGVTTHRPGERFAVDSRGNVSCGTPVPGVAVRIDGEGSDAGEILVQGPGLFAGYFDDPGATRAIIRDG